MPGRLLLAVALGAGPAAAADPLLQPPLDCDLGAVCYIQQYVDADPGPGAADHMCGHLANDGHKGTDFALPSRAMMDRGIDVLAAAPGTVESVRDGMPDIARTEPDAPDLDGRDCGNGVRISHGSGWETQYCHLKRGSVAVAPGERVRTATVLGQVGLSGATTFPHIHLSVRRDGAVVDPFDPDAGADCTGPPERTLWSDPPDYAPGGLVAAGFADHVPPYDAVKAGDAAQASLDARAPALVVWGYAFGVLSGDVLSLSIQGPEGPVISDDVVMAAAQPLAYRAIGRRAPDGGWAVGRYRGRVEHRRDGEVLDTLAVEIPIGAP